MNDDVPDEFPESIFPDYVRMVTGNAVIGAQYVERVLNALCLILCTKGLRFSLEDFMSGDSRRTRQTLGMIQTQFRETQLFDPSFSERLSTFTQRRNRVVHGFFADSFKSHNDIHYKSPQAVAYVDECQWVSKEAAQLVEIGFGIYRAFGEILLRSDPNDPKLAELLTGFDEYHNIGLAALSVDLRPRVAPQKRDQ